MGATPRLLPSCHSDRPALDVSVLLARRGIRFNLARTSRTCWQYRPDPWRETYTGVQWDGLAARGTIVSLIRQVLDGIKGIPERGHGAHHDWGVTAGEGYWLSTCPVNASRTPPVARNCIVWRVAIAA